MRGSTIAWGLTLLAGGGLAIARATKPGTGPAKVGAVRPIYRTNHRREPTLTAFDQQPTTARFFNRPLVQHVVLPDVPVPAPPPGMRVLQMTALRDTAIRGAPHEDGRLLEVVRAGQHVVIRNVDDVRPGTPGGTSGWVAAHPASVPVGFPRTGWISLADFTDPLLYVEVSANVAWAW